MSTLQKIQLGVPGTEENAKLAHADFSFDIIEMIPFPVVYIGNNNRYEYVNKAYLDWRGVNKENVIGKKVDEFLEPSVYELAKEHILIALNGNPTKYEIELPYRTGHRYAEVIYTPEFDKDGNVKGYLAFAIDITERKKSEELNARLAAIVQSSDATGKTLDGIITS
jgi:PAS domain S-box-containing protein